LNRYQHRLRSRGIRPSKRFALSKRFLYQSFFFLGK
jgi:hypothetical protein